MVSVLAFNLIFEVEFKRLVLYLDVLDITLKFSHMALLFVQLNVHLIERLFLLFLHSFHRCGNVIFSFIQLLVLLLEVRESVFERIDRVLLTIIAILVVRNDLFQEFSVLVQVSQLGLLVFQLHLLLVDALSQFFDCLLVFECCGVELLETFVLLLALLLILKDLLLVSGDISQDFPLSLQELLLLLVELLCLRNDVFLLLIETLVDFSLLSLLLQKAHGLKWALTLHDEGSDSSQVLIVDFRVRVLAHVLVDPIEQLIDFTLLVDVHPSFIV